MPGAGTHPRLAAVLCNLFLPFFLVCGLATFYLGPVALLLMVLLLILQWLLVVDHIDLKVKSMPWLLLVWACSALTALYVGSRAHHNIYAPYRLAARGRDALVPARAMASGFLDGRALTFEDGYVLDDVRAVGFRAFGSTYCAAPVVSLKAEEAFGDYPVVQFWAVGLDCCGARGQFVCDAAGEEGARGGIVMHDPAEEETIMGTLLAPRKFPNGWQRAIEASCALHEFNTAKEPVMVAWVGNDPDGVLNWWYWQAVLAWLGASLVHALLAWAAWTMLQANFPPLGKGRRGGADEP